MNIEGTLKDQCVWEWLGPDQKSQNQVLTDHYQIRSSFFFGCYIPPRGSMRGGFYEYGELDLTYHWSVLSSPLGMFINSNCLVSFLFGFFSNVLVYSFSLWSYVIVLGYNASYAYLPAFKTLLSLSLSALVSLYLAFCPPPLFEFTTLCHFSSKWKCSWDVALSRAATAWVERKTPIDITLNWTQHTHTTSSTTPHTTATTHSHDAEHTTQVGHGEHERTSFD